MVTQTQISKTKMFQGLSDQVIDELTSISKLVNFSKGDFIFREGETAEKIYFLLDGKISIRVSLTSKPESITVSVINQSFQGFGWSGIVSPFHYTASAKSEEDCRVIEFQGKKFIEVLSQHPEAGFIMMQRLTEIISSRLSNSRQALLKTL